MIRTKIKRFCAHFPAYHTLNNKMLNVEDNVMNIEEEEEVHNNSSDDDDEEEELLFLSSSVQFNADIPAVIVSWLKELNRQHRSTRRILRNPALFNERLQWNHFIQRFGGRADFKRHIRMSLDSFTKLLSHIRPLLVVDTEMARR